MDVLLQLRWWTYDPVGRISEITLANDTKTTYSYDDAGRLTGVTNEKADQTVISSFAYTYDDAGNRPFLLQSLVQSLNLTHADTQSQRTSTLQGVKP